MQISSSISTRLQYQHKAVIDIIDDLSDEQIRRAVLPGKWSIFENIVHLVTYQHVFIGRLKMILLGHTPEFPRYTAESDPLFYDNCAKTTREIMSDFVTTRKEMVAAILAYPETDLEKKGTHPVFGKMNVLQWLNFFLLHEAHHLFTMFKLAAELRKL